MRTFILTLVIIITMGNATAQDLHFVYLKDKPQTSFNPEQYFSPKAMQRRIQQNLPPYDYQDLPINPTYTNTISTIVDSVRYQLRWLNALSVKATPEQIKQIQQLPFVKGTEPFGQDFFIAQWQEAVVDSQMLDTLLFAQRAQMNLPLFQQNNITAQGIRIAIIDVGFRHVDTHPAFEHIRSAKRIIATKDFYGNKESVYRHNSHGTQVLGCIAGFYGDRPIGCATNAEFLLARTESSLFEKPIEEDHWIAALQWADQNGAYIINSSLGYTQKRYTYEDMDGKTAPVSKAAEIGAQKGLLIVSSIGNDGTSKWRYLGAPSDAPHVLAIGGTLPMLRLHIPFSSLGPSANNIMKPDLAAPGYVMTSLRKGKYGTTSGTSFSSPLVAGFAACLAEMYPEKSGKDLFEFIRTLGHLYPYYDYAHGFGVPDAAKLFPPDTTMQYGPVPTFTVAYSPKQDSVFVTFDTLMPFDMSQQAEQPELYYHFENEEGILDGYDYQIVPNNAAGFVFPRRTNIKGTLRIWFKGQLYEKELE